MFNSTADIVKINTKISLVGVNALINVVASDLAKCPTYGSHNQVKPIYTSADTKLSYSSL